MTTCIHTHQAVGSCYTVATVHETEIYIKKGTNSRPAGRNLRDCLFIYLIRNLSDI